MSGRILDFSDGYTSVSSPSDVSSTSMTIANATGPSSITSMTLDNTTYRGYVIEADISRKTSSSERRGFHLLRFVYDTTAVAWVILPVDEWNTGTELGVTYTMSSTQVQYTTDSQAGSSYAGTLKWVILRRYGA